MGVVNVLKKVGQVTIIRQCTTLSGWLVTHPYLTFVAYNAIFVAMCYYAWHEGYAEGKSVGYGDGVKATFDRAYKAGYDSGEAFGRIEQRTIDKEIYSR